MGRGCGEQNILFQNLFLVFFWFLLCDSRRVKLFYIKYVNRNDTVLYIFQGFQRNIRRILEKTHFFLTSICPSTVKIFYQFFDCNTSCRFYHFIIRPIHIYLYWAPLKEKHEILTLFEYTYFSWMNKISLNWRLFDKTVPNKFSPFPAELFPTLCFQFDPCLELSRNDFFIKRALKIEGSAL